MANPYFRFKQFTVRHDRCGMKVGTDGVLIGAWCPVRSGIRVLDIGAGSGLIALMLAQRGAGHVVAVELDEHAAFQARENVEESPFVGRISVVQSDIQDYCCEEKFDLIVSNPPYFDFSLQSPDQKRTLARHTESLTYEDLIKRAVELLADQGQIALVVPSVVEQKLDRIALDNGLHPLHKTYVLPKQDSTPKRLLVTYAFEDAELQSDSLVIELARHHYSDDFIKLTKEFYLKM